MTASVSALLSKSYNLHMKYLLGILAAVFALATVGVFILFVRVFTAWLEKGVNLLVPGLGLVVSGPIVPAGLFIVGAILLALTMFLARTAFRKPPLG